MDAPTRWNVTFTKHLKQKRKVYRDGFLSLHSSTGKVMLYDDSEQLLECRILRNDEVVSSGETLTFNAYLVDVGELEEGQKPLDGTSIRSPEDKVPKGRASLHRNKFVKVSDCADEKTKAEKDKQQTISLSPSQKIMREFKKNEMNKYGILQTSPNSRTSSTADWHALYTTHLTQKSKKYHDGFLRCTSSGSMTRQVFLYDTSWKLLDSRFLNRAEEVSPGEMMEFPGHLVEVGNSKANHESLRDLNACGSSFNSLHKLHMQKQKHNVTTLKSAVKEEKNGQMHHDGANGNILEAGKSSVTEWQVLYTTQVTQKAKKYHDGFLQLEVRGSLGGQVTLYDASRKVLANKFLRKDEVLGTGKSLVFDSHLVDIGEHAEEKASMGLNDHEPCRAAGEMRKGHGEVNGVKVDQSIMGVLWQKDGDKTSGKVHPARDLDSNSGISDMKSTDCIRRVPENKPLRNACQILSVLRRPLDQVATAEISDERKATFASLTKELQHSDNSSDGAQRQRAPAAKLASVENVDTGNITDTSGNEKLLGLMKTKDVATDFHDYHSMAGFGIGNSQPCHKPADPKFCGNNLASEASLSRGSGGDADDEKTTPEGDRDPLKVKAECPSFDLGF